MRNTLGVYSLFVVFWIFTVSLCALPSNFAQTSENDGFAAKTFGFSIENNKKKKEKKTNREQFVELNSEKSDSDVFRIDTTLIVNEVLVFDQNGQPVNGLNKNDFIVSEDNNPQEIEIFSRGDSDEIPRFMVLIVDYSGSQLPYIQTSIGAAEFLVNSLKPKDRMAIVTDDVELLQGFTNDKILLREKLESLKQSALKGITGRSRQFSALMAVLNEMFPGGAAQRPIIIFQTDGDELSFLNDQNKSASLPKLDFNFQDILAATEKNGAVVYTIIPGVKFVGIPGDEKLERAKLSIEESEKAHAVARGITFKPEKFKISDERKKSWADQALLQQNSLGKIAAFTGGTTSYLETPDQSEIVYSEILSEINRRYVLGYYPTNAARGDQIRKVKTEIRGHPEYTVKGRKNYILPPEK